MNKLNPSFDEITEACDDMSETIKNLKVETIVAITRGGLVPGVILSQHTDIPMIPISYSSHQGKGEFKAHNNKLPYIHGNVILIVDDICDSGHTMKEVVDHYNYGRTVYSFSLFFKEGSCITPDIFCWKLTADSGWVVFPWEKNPA